LPFVFRSNEHVKRVVNGPIFELGLRPMAQKVGVDVLGVIDGEKTGDLVGLATKVDRYETMFAEIERDFSWNAKLAAKGTSNPPELQLTISVQRKLQIQPLLVGKLAFGAVPLFDNDAFRTAQVSERYGFADTQRINYAPVQFFVEKDLAGNIRDYRTRRLMDIRPEEFSGFDVKVIVYLIEDTGYIRPPLPVSVCFQIRFKRGTLQNQASETDGVRCSEEFDHVDRFLPRLGT
jgi:hypothetical protein